MPCPCLPLIILAVASAAAAQPCQPRWSPLTGGVSGGKKAPFVSAMAVFDDGTGPALYVGGRFTHAGGIAAPSLARGRAQYPAPIACWTALRHFAICRAPTAIRTTSPERRVTWIDPTP